MPRPTTLIIETSAERRQVLSHGLAAAGFEAVPVSTVEQGLTFAQALSSAVIIIPAELATQGKGELLADLTQLTADRNRTLVVLGNNHEPDQFLPQHVVFTHTEGLSDQLLLERLSLILVGREIGIEPDIEIHSLVGDLGHNPLLELTQRLAQTGLPARIELIRGGISVNEGQVIAARADSTKGLKAFCRLCRQHEGVFHIRLEGFDTAREIDLDIHELVVEAIEESLAEFPEPNHILLPQRQALSQELSDIGRRLLTAVGQGREIQALLDEMPETDGTLLAEIQELEDWGLLRRTAPKVDIKVLTDSTSDLPPDVAREHGIEIVPLSVHFGSRKLLDRVDLQPSRFYELLQSDPNHPSSSPPSEERFDNIFHAQGAESSLLSLHISAKLSETFTNASAAADRLRAARKVSDDDRPLALEIFDSRQVSLGLGLLAIFAARMASRDLEIEHITRRLEAMRDRIQSLFVVDTMDYLVRGGRVSKSKAFFGKMLGIKPILGVESGEIVAVDRVRGGRAAHPRLVELVKQRLAGKKQLIAYITHANAPVWADRLRKLLVEEFEVQETLVGEMGPVVGTHAGPGTVGMAVFPLEGDESELLAPISSASQANPNPD